MSKSNKPTLTSLPLDDPHRLLEELKKPVAPEQLDAVDGVRVEGQPSLYKSVHAHVLQAFLFADSNESADAYFVCCERLIELRAPITDLYGLGAVAQFTGCPWPIDPAQLQQFSELADKYVAAGMMELDAQMAGNPLSRAERKTADGGWADGLKPLAAAVFNENAPLVSYLLARGVSLDLGTVYPGEAPMTALQLADEERNGEIKALIAENILQSQLAGTELATVSTPNDRAVRRRHSL